MEKQRLLQTLEQLHKELSQTEHVDPETLAELETLTSEIRSALDQRSAKSAAEVEPVSGLRDLLLRYEADHPQLSAAIGRVADALAAMGF
jgi:hypothetical protein